MSRQGYQKLDLDFERDGTASDLCSMLSQEWKQVVSATSLWAGHSNKYVDLQSCWTTGMFLQSHVQPVDGGKVNQKNACPWKLLEAIGFLGFLDAEAHICAIAILSSDQ